MENEARASHAEIEIGEDLQITRCTRRNAGGGTWVCGTLNGHRFVALVFPQHASNPEYEIEDSRISKLWLQRLADRKPVYRWERGLDLPLEDQGVQRILEFLCSGLAEHTYGE